MDIEKLGRYDIIRILGRGAMGIVYEARDPNLDRKVAIKTVKIDGLSKESELEYEMRFRTEARSAGRLQHPNIVSVYDADRDDTTPFLVMEFVSGLDLKHHLDHGTRYTLEQSVRMMRDLLSALDYAHQRKIIHRDIKPANLLIEPSGRLKLTDFGVARIQDSGEATRTQGGMVGTLKYMSPEQAQGLPVDASSDIFSAGIVLYQLLTDRRPFDGESYFEILTQITQANPAPPSTINDKLPDALNAVVARALAKTKAERFATAADFSAALLTASRRANDLTITPSANPLKPIVMSRNGDYTSGTSASATVTNTSSTGSTITQELELVYWKDVKDSADIEDLEGFLAKFPNAIYADLAKRRLKKLYELNTSEGIANDFEQTQIAGKPAVIAAAAPTPQQDLTQVPSQLAKPAAQAPISGLDIAGLDATSPEPRALIAATEVTPTLKDNRPDTFPDSSAQTLPTPLAATQTQSDAVAKLASPEAAQKAPKVDSEKTPKAGRGKAWLAGGLVATFGAAAWLWFSLGMTGTPPVPAIDPAVLASSAAKAGATSPEMTATVLITASITSPVLTSTPESSVTTASSANPLSGLALTSSPATSAPDIIATTVKKPLPPRSPASANPSMASNPSPYNPGIPKPGVENPPSSAASKPRITVGSPSSQPSGAVSPPQAVPSQAPAPAANAGDPQTGCGGRVLFALQTCMTRQCERPEFQAHPACKERREMDERRRSTENQR